MAIARVDHDGRREFVLELDGRRRGFLDYALQPGVLRIDYVEVAPDVRGGGHGKALVEAAVAFARERHLRVEPICGYARAVMQRDPALAAILA